MDMNWLKEFIDERIDAGHKVSAAAPNTIHSGVVVDHFGHVVNTAAAGGGGLRLSYSSGVGQTFATGTTRRLIQFDTQEYASGSGGAVTTGTSWVFTNTGPATIYCVNVCIHITLFAWAAANRGELSLHLNNTTTPVRYFNGGNGFGNGSSSYTRMLQGTTTIQLQTNDTIDFRFLQNTGSTLSLTGTSDQNYIDIFSL